MEEEWDDGLFTGTVNGQLQKMLWYSHAAGKSPLGQHRPDPKIRCEYVADATMAQANVFDGYCQREGQRGGRWTLRHEIVLVPVGPGARVPGN